MAEFWTWYSIRIPGRIGVFDNLQPHLYILLNVGFEAQAATDDVVDVTSEIAPAANACLAEIQMDPIQTQQVIQSCMRILLLLGLKLHLLTLQVFLSCCRFHTIHLFDAPGKPVA